VLHANKFQKLLLKKSLELVKFESRGMSIKQLKKQGNFVRHFFAVILAVNIFSFSPVEACSLAQHSWERIFKLEIPLLEPIFPLAEVDSLKKFSNGSSPQKIFWVTQNPLSAVFPLLFFGMLQDPAEDFFLCDWTTDFSQQKDFKLSGKVPPIIFGIAKTTLSVMVFSDRNSNFCCHQLVFQQKSSLRLLSVSEEAPRAEENVATTWISIIFYLFPAPNKILTISFSPWKGQPISVFENSSLVEGLLKEKKLKFREVFVPEPHFPTNSEDEP